MCLARFFLSVRITDGTEYEPETLKGYLGSLPRYLRENGNQHKVESHLFSLAREVLRSKRNRLKSQGKGKGKRKAEPLAHNDFIKLRESNQLGSCSSCKLLLLCFCLFVFYFSFLFFWGGAVILRQFTFSISEKCVGSPLK